MKRILLLIIYSGIYSLVFCQTSFPKEYNIFIKQTDSLYKIKDYKNAAACFSKAFETWGWTGLLNDRYDAACCWALSGNIDSSFFNLMRIGNKGKYSDYFKIINERKNFKLNRKSSFHGIYSSKTD